MSEKKYFEGVGRRKTSTARVRIIPAPRASFLINDSKNVDQYFPTEELRAVVNQVMSNLKLDQKFAVSARLSGGGIASQAVALRHGIARALVVWKPELRLSLKKLGFLARDGRAKERRKFGLKKARKAPQWSKR